VRRQSEHFATYGKALDQLAARGLIYPCFCSRAEIEAELALRPTRRMPDGPLYPGHLSASLCRGAAGQDRRRRGTLPSGSTAERAAKEAGPYHFFDETWAASQASRC